MAAGWVIVVVVVVVHSYISAVVSSTNLVQFGSIGYVYGFSIENS
jgi:hypothetical protein